jgi:hypothetical protein
MAERGITVDHATFLAPCLEIFAVGCVKCPIWETRYGKSLAYGRDLHAGSGLVDLSLWSYRSARANLDCMLSTRCNLAAARRFFKKAIGTNGSGKTPPALPAMMTEWPVVSAPIAEALFWSSRTVA